MYMSRIAAIKPGLPKDRVFVAESIGNHREPRARGQMKSVLIIFLPDLLQMLYNKAFAVKKGWLYRKKIWQNPLSPTSL